MKQLFRTLLFLVGVLALPVHALAEALNLPIEFRPQNTLINYQDVRGVPISPTVGDPPGSNGLQPTGNESTGIFTPPTPGQFQGLMMFGGTTGLNGFNIDKIRSSSILRAGVTPFSAVVATEMHLPVAKGSGDFIMILRRAQIGAPYLIRGVSFSFGSIVPPPEKDELDLSLNGVPNTAYWLPEPFTTNNHVGASYYWSPHARQVYAIQPGPVSITWRKAASYSDSNPPPDTYTNVNGIVSFQTNGASIFLLHTVNYIASGSGVKLPRKMYWTQRGFQNLGVPIRVPTARVGAVNIVYNNNFPRTVDPDQEFSGVGSTLPTEGSTNAVLQELRTFWYDEQLGNAFAYNAEGRFFVELLGDLRSDGETREPLGIEIVDVSKQAIPSDITVELGERVIPPEGGSVEDLFPQQLSTSFTYLHDVAGAARTEIYALKETFNLNDYLVHWLEEGEAGLKWPRLFGRYNLAWPTNVSKFSHYVRPPAATEDEAAKTAVVLQPENAPNIEYQDALDRPRAKFTPDFKQVDTGNGLPVPGLILTFRTTIADGLNLFGRPLAAGDHAFSASSFATKIFGVGAALDGYLGMANPAANSGAVIGAGGSSASEPDLSFLDASAMSATPYIYLIPVGVDSMRSPPLGDSTEVRTWSVQDLAIPMPFNIGASGFSDKALFQSTDSLSEPLFALRKHQAFRPVSSRAYFSNNLYGSAGGLVRSQFTNNRLIGRSVWNSQWKLIIPGRTLLNNPNEGLERFIRTVNDIQLHFVTYSYSGN